MKIDSWMRVRDVHYTYLFGKDNCRLASFLKRLEGLMKVEGIQICDNPSLEKLTSLFITNNTVILVQRALRRGHLLTQDPDQISICKEDNFWKYTCCIKFHCAWLVLLEALASHAVIANALITTQLHKCWIKYLTELLLGIENNLDPYKNNYV